MDNFMLKGRITSIECGIGTSAMLKIVIKGEQTQTINAQEYNIWLKLVTKGDPKAVAKKTSEEYSITDPALMSILLAAKDYRITFISNDLSSNEIEAFKIQYN